MPDRDDTPRRITVRDAVPADHTAIGEVTARVYIDGGYSSASREPFLRDVATRAAAGDLLVAIEGATGGVLGAVTLAPRGSPYAPLAGEHQAEVRLLAVSAAARGSGAGMLLMQALVERGKQRGLSGIVLSTQPTMTAAHRIYERLGFVRIPERDYITGEGRVMLVYLLTL